MIDNTCKEREDSIHGHHVMSWMSYHTISLVTSPCVPPGEKRSGEQSRISWAYSPKQWKTNEIVRSLIIT